MWGGFMYTSYMSDELKAAEERYNQLTEESRRLNDEFNRLREREKEIVKEKARIQEQYRVHAHYRLEERESTEEPPKDVPEEDPDDLWW